MAFVGFASMGLSGTPAYQLGTQLGGAKLTRRKLAVLAQSLDSAFE
jgi:hypothetical protein